MDNVKEIAAQIAEAHRKQLDVERGQRVRETIKEKAERGEPNGCPPVGYVNRWEGRRVFVEVHPEQGPLVTEAFQLAATSGKPLREMVVIMSMRGMRSRRGGFMDASSFQRMLQNPFYLGMVRTKYGTVPGYHQALTDEETFTAVRVAIQVRKAGAQLSAHDPIWG